MKTEQRLDKKLWIDKMVNSDALISMLENQSQAIDAVRLVIKDIEKIVDMIVQKLQLSNKNRIIYLGAGTSARIGVQDGAELYPTFGFPKSRISYVIAGGISSLTQSIEGAEDDCWDAIKQIEELKIKKGDVILALSASGITPFVLEAIRKSKFFGATVVGISNNPEQKLQSISDFSITLDTGPEIIAGSTRLKAGTAQKICLNMISTLCMTRLGKVKDGLMVNMVPSNNKLIKRMNIINALK